MKISIRHPKPSDITQYTDLLQKTYELAYVNEELGLTKECFSKEIFSTKNTQEYLQSHLVNTDNQKTWLAFDGAILVGAITVIIKNYTEAELTGFYVDSMYQGSGIGRQLYSLALDFTGTKDLLLDIYTHNKKTIDIYTKWGWKIDKTRGDKGFFYRHWPEWPEGLEAKCMYMRLKE